jgi:hypothetical protein
VGVETRESSKELIPRCFLLPIWELTMNELSNNLLNNNKLKERRKQNEEKDCTCNGYADSRVC